MQLPLHIAQKMQQLIAPGELISVSRMNNKVVDKMLQDGILLKKQIGKTKAQIYLPDAVVLKDYLHNHFGISDLDLYVATLLGDGITRAAAAHISSDSKLKSIRTFSGFLTNVYQSVKGTMHGDAFIIHPLPGSFTFVHDYENFVPDPAVIIVGIENAENFSQIAKQQYLFKNIQPLFVSRYPQSNDLVKWLQLIPNPYLHFGDLDFAGIHIYINEFKKYLGERASFFIPPQTEKYLAKFGNRTLYNKQLGSAATIALSSEKGIPELLQLIHQHKKVLEQEAFIGAILG